MYQFKPGQDDEILQGGSEFLFFGGYFSMVAQSKASSTKAISLWKRSSGRSSAAKCKSAKSRKWALVIWKPKSARTMFQTNYMDSSLRYSEILLDNNWLFARAWAPENWLSAGPCGVWREVLGSLSMQRFWGTDGNRKWTFRRPEQCSFPDFQTSGLCY